MQRDLPAGLTLALHIDLDLVVVAKGTDPVSRPGEPFGRALAEAVEKGRQAGVGHEARQSADHLLDRNVRFPAMQPRAIFDDLQLGVVATLPMQRQAKALIDEGDNDLLRTARKRRFLSAGEQAG